MTGVARRYQEVNPGKNGDRRRFDDSDTIGAVQMEGIQKSLVINSKKSSAKTTREIETQDEERKVTLGG